MNLTALTEPHDVAVKHFVDSLMTYDTYFPGKVLADVGTGAGFPGIPLKIFCPSLKVVFNRFSCQKAEFFAECY